MGTLQNINTGETINKAPTQDLANAGYVPVATPAVMTADSFNTANPVKLPDTNVAAPSNPANINTDPTVLNAPETSLQKSINDLMKLNTDVAGKDAYRASLESSDQTLQEQKKAETDLTAQVKALQAEALNIPNQVQLDATGKGVTAGGIEPIQTAMLRNNAIKAQTVGALLAATQGKIAYAQSLIDKAVQDQFGPLEAKQKALMANLDLIIKSPEYTNAEKAKATAQKAIEDANAQKLEQAKTDKASILSTATEAAKNGADALTLKKISEAATPLEAITLAGRFMKVQPDNVQALITKYPDAGILPTDNLSVAQGKLQNSAIYKKESSTPDKYSSAKDAMGNLLTFNSSTGRYTTMDGKPATAVTTPDGTGILDQPSVSKFLAGKTPSQISAFNGMDDLAKSDVMQLLNGDVLLSDLMTSRGVQGAAAKQKLLMQARAVDPSFSENSNKQAYAFKNEWNNTNGKAYNNRVAINTAMGHLADLKTISNNLQSDGNFMKANSINQWVQNNINGPDAANVAMFTQSAEQLAHELATVYAGGTAPDEKSIQNQRDIINSMKPKDIINALINNDVALLSSKLSAAGEEYKKVVKQYPDQLLSDDNLNALEKAGVDINPVKKTLIKQGMPAKTIFDYVMAFPEQKDAALKIKKENPDLSDDEILQVLQPDYSSGGGSVAVHTLKKVIARTDGAHGGQCGSFVNGITKLGLGDSYESKMSKMDPTIQYPEPGMVFVMPYKDTGHTGFILDVKDGMATVKDSNYSLDEKIKVHQIPVNKITGLTYA